MTNELIVLSVAVVVSWGLALGALWCALAVSAQAGADQEGDWLQDGESELRS